MRIISQPDVLKKSWLFGHGAQGIRSILKNKTYKVKGTKKLRKGEYWQIDYAIYVNGPTRVFKN
jgi:hypothetical protein